MQVPIMRDPAGLYYADVFMDQTPQGFEDTYLESMAHRRFTEGRGFAEMGTPITDHLTGDPVATLRRILCIEDRNICAFVSPRNMDANGNHIRYFIRAYGPMGPHLDELFNMGKPLALAFRILKQTDPDDEDEQIITGVPSVDIIQI